MMMGVCAAGLQFAKSRWTPQCAKSALTRSDAGSPFILAIGKASQPRYARIDKTLPHVPPAQERTGDIGLSPRTRSRAMRPVPKTFGFATEVIREPLLLLAAPVEAQDRPVKVQRVALVRIDDVAGVDCPRALELDDVFLGQGIPEPRIAGRKGQNGTGVVRSDEVIEPRERAAPASGKLR